MQIPQCGAKGLNVGFAELGEKAQNQPKSHVSNRTECMCFVTLNDRLIICPLRRYHNERL